MPSDLCDECQSIFNHWCDRDEWAERRPNHFHHSISGLEDSARRGCALCSLFFDSLDADDVRNIRSSNISSPSLVNFVTDKPYPECYIFLDFLMPDDEKVEAKIEVFPASGI